MRNPRPTRNGLSVIAGALLAAGLACSLTGGGTVTPTSAPPTVAAPPTPTPEPQPVDLYDAMQARVETGELSQGEALVEALKVFTGENSPAAFTAPGQTLTIHSAWGISMQALDYLQSGDDEALKLDIERLLNVIAPQQTNLDAYAEPAPAGGRPRGLSAPAPLQPEADCRGLWDLGFPTDTPERPVCLRYETAVSIGGSEVHVYYPREWADRADVRGRIDAALSAARRSYDAYTALDMRFRSVNIIFTLLTPPGRIFEEALAFVPDRNRLRIGLEPCPVMVFPLAATLTDEQFQQTIAHEFFHCAQYWRYEFSYVASTRWWVEGSAEYFSNVVYDSVDYEHRWNRGFQNMITGAQRPLVEIEYPSWIFFQYYANRLGNAGVLDLLDSLPVTGGLDGQYAALNRIPDFEDLFHDFGKAYLDGTIADNGTGPMTFSPAFTDTFEFPGGGPAGLFAQPLTLPYYKLVFHPSHTFTASLETSGSAGRSSAKPSAEGDAWGRLPAEINAGCGDREYQVLITSTDPAGTGTDFHTLDVSTPTDSALTGDSCLIAQWQLDVSTMESYFQGRVPAGSDLIFDSAAGVFHGEFRDDCTVSHRTEGYVLQYHQNGPRGRVGLKFRDDTVSSGFWGVNDANEIVGYDSTTTVNIGVTLTIGGVTTTTNSDIPSGYLAAGGIGDGTFPYTCDASTLVLYPPAGLEGAPESWTYTRVGP